MSMKSVSASSSIFASRLGLYDSTTVDTASFYIKFQSNEADDNVLYKLLQNLLQTDRQWNATTYVLTNEWSIIN